MLFRNKEGKLVELMKCKFTSDTDYYKAIMDNRGLTNIAKANSERNKIIGIIKRKKEKVYRARVQATPLTKCSSVSHYSFPQIICHLQIFPEYQQ